MKSILILILCQLLLIGPSSSYPGEEKENMVRSTEQYGVGKKLERSIKKLRRRFGLKPAELAIIVVISEQKMYLMKGEEVEKIYPISTSKYGIGSRARSNKTPPGTHRVAEKIGEGAPVGTIFKGRVSTGRTAEIYTNRAEHGEDLITTRIIWLEGLEQGINKGKGIDSHQRYIYIHGTPEEGLIGTPASHGCIRMKNADIIELFDLIDIGALVEIVE